MRPHDVVPVNGLAERGGVTRVNARELMATMEEHFRWEDVAEYTALMVEMDVEASAEDWLTFGIAIGWEMRRAVEREGA